MFSRSLNVILQDSEGAPEGSSVVDSNNRLQDAAAIPTDPTWHDLSPSAQIMQSEHCGGVSARGAQLSGLPIHVCRTTMKAPNDLTTHNLPEPKWLRTDFSSGSSLDKPVPAHSNRNQTNSESTPGNPVCTPSESNRTPSILRATPSTLRLKPSELRVFCGQLRYHSE